MIIVYETVAGVELDTVTVTDSGPRYETGKARGVVDQAVRRSGSLDAALAELAAGWSNGYVVTRVSD